MSNVTAQTSGQLSVWLKLDWNTLWTNSSTTVGGMPVTPFDSIQYGPASEPPPAWTLNQQYSSASYPNGVPGFGAFIPNGQGNLQFGYAFLGSILDMSSNSVVNGKTYAVTTDLMSDWLQLYFVVSGTPAGSTVLPGFGLYNLASNPGAWTYVTPEQFTGEWQIGLLTYNSVAPVWLKVEYAPPRVYYYESPLTAKVIFTCTGGWQVLLASDESGAAILTGGSTALPTAGIQHIHERSDPYILRSAAGKVLELV